MEQYWSINETLMKYYEIITKHVCSHLKNLNLKDVDAMKEKMKNFVRNYIDPKEGDDGKLIIKRSQADPENWEQYTLPEGVLDLN